MKTGIRVEDVVVYGLNVAALDADDTGWHGWLDPARLARVGRYHFREDRARCLGAGLLLAYAVRQYYPHHPLPPGVAVEETGKPYLPDFPDFHFNLSHSGAWVVCVAGGVPLGVDIERLDRITPGLTQRCFTPSERKFLEALPAPQSHGAFFDLWTLKESYMKATGQGMRLSLQSFSVRPKTLPVLSHPGSSEDYVLDLCAFVDQDYRLAVAARQSGPLAAKVRVVGLDELRQALTG